MKVMSKMLLSSAVSLACASAFAGNVEVLHWWTSGGEAKAIGELKKELEASGHTWEDFAVAGGGGESAMTVLKSRAVSGNPPEAAQIKGPEIQEWAELDLLTNLDDVASEQKWDELVPSVVTDIMKYDGHYVAVPVNVHRINWLWANPALLDKAGVSIPTTWEEFFAAGDALKAAGITPMAYGGQPWQDATVFEAMLMGLEGPEFYQQAFVDLDPDALGSDKMVNVFKQYRRLKDYIDPNYAGRDWNIATAMVINGEAAMQIMGDWAKGEISAAGKVPGKDILCAPSPGTGDDFMFNVDSFVMFEVSDKDDSKAQRDLARLILEPSFQEVFNLNKGSIPVRSGMDMSEFDQCAQNSEALFAAAAESGSLKPSMAHDMAIQPGAKGAILDVVTNFFNNDSVSAEDATQQLVKAVEAAK